MALLDLNDKNFETSVTRKWLHYKSTDLSTLVRKLTEFQSDNTNAVKLVALYQALYDWVRKHPKEFAKRGSRVQALRGEILLKAPVINADIRLVDNQFRSVNHVWTFLQDIKSKLAPHVNTLRNIEITDQPTGQAGVYTFTPGNVYSEGDRNLANTDTTEVNANKQFEPKYWLRLGRRVITPQQDGKSYGRCFSCAGAVIYKMVMDPAFDEYMIEHVGAEDYDHHLVLLDRPNANGTDDTGLNNMRTVWMGTAAVVDVWQGNLNNNTNYVQIAVEHQYAQSNLRWFCAFPPNRRVQDRQFASGLQAPQRNVQRLDIVQNARQAIQDQGEQTRNVRRADGKWGIEKLVNGHWVQV
ncbi:MAG: hypothetical protein JNM40_01865 [Myxococcales bacterium]|nr:hypothetical protein [Myxococcales bacterium]